MSSSTAGIFDSHLEACVVSGCGAHGDSTSRPQRTRIQGADRIAPVGALRASGAQDPRGKSFERYRRDE
jgi:hypothetical protein